ncbi:uncharacterized protein LOC144435754 [Glandiceps talaboti]
MESRHFGRILAWSVCICIVSVVVKAQEDYDDADLPPGAIAGIILFCVVFFGLVLCASYMRWRRRMEFIRQIRELEHAASRPRYTIIVTDRNPADVPRGAYGSLATNPNAPTESSKLPRAPPPPPYQEANRRTGPPEYRPLVSE